MRKNTMMSKQTKSKEDYFFNKFFFRTQQNTKNETGNKNNLEKRKTQQKIERENFFLVENVTQKF